MTHDYSHSRDKDYYSRDIISQRRYRPQSTAIKQILFVIMEKIIRKVKSADTE